MDGISLSLRTIVLLTTILRPHIQQWALILSAYTHDTIYKKSGDYANTDELSLLLLDHATEPNIAVTCHLLFSCIYEL